MIVYVRHPKWVFHECGSQYAATAHGLESITIRIEPLWVAYWVCGIWLLTIMIIFLRIIRDSQYQSFCLIQLKTMVNKSSKSDNK